MKNKKVNWIAIGKKLEHVEGTHQVKKNCHIEIYEEDLNLKCAREDTNDTVGVPINAALAISLIRKLWKEALVNFSDTQSDQQKSEKSRNSAEIEELLNSSNPEELKNSISKLFAQFKEAEYWAEEFIRNTFAITFDKSVLLKTLSQPRCEGLRLYLCAKEDKVSKIGKEHGVISLVVVGIDADCKDLSYDYPDTVVAGKSQLEKGSSILEYGLSSSHFTLDINDKRLEPFVLFKHAIQP